MTVVVFHYKLERCYVIDSAAFLRLLGLRHWRDFVAVCPRISLPILITDRRSHHHLYDRSSGSPVVISKMGALVAFVDTFGAKRYVQHTAHTVADLHRIVVASSYSSSDNDGADVSVVGMVRLANGGQQTYRFHHLADGEGIADLAAYFADQRAMRAG